MALRLAYGTTGIVNYWSSTGTTLAASSAVSALPASASANPDRSYAWRSCSSTANDTLDADLGSAVTITFAGVANPVVPTGGTLKLQQGGTSTSGAGTYADVGTFATMDPDTKVTVLYTTGVSARYWRLLFSHSTSSTSTSYSEAGYVQLSTYIEPQDIANQSAFSLTDPSVRRDSVDGQSTYTRRSRYMTGSFAIPFASRTDLEAIRTLYRAVGTSTPIFVTTSTSVSWQAWLLRLGSVLDQPHDGVDRWNITIGWEEAR